MNSRFFNNFFSSGSNLDEDYYTKTQTDNLLNTKANSDHSHVMSDITGLSDKFDGMESEISSANSKADEALSRNVFTDEEKSKLANITDPIIIKGRVDTVDNLPTTAKVGWFYFVGLENASSYEEYCYSESGWEYIGVSAEGVDLSDYYTKSQTDSMLNTKVNNGDCYTKTESDNLIDGKISSPNTATVGQILSVKTVDETGKPTEWEVVNKPGSAPGESSPYIYITLDEYMNLTEKDPNKLYWVLNPDFTHAVYNNEIFIEGSDISFWYGIQKKVRNGTIQDYYSVGDQLSVNYNGSAVMFDIVAFDVATPTDSNYTHSMTLMSHDCLESLMFDNKEPYNSNSDRKSYGNNRYLYSNIRKWLNSNGEAGNWWTAQHSADAAPDYATTKAGFMSYFDNDFLSVIGKTKIKVIKNTDTDGGGYEEISGDYFYLPSETEVGLGNENNIAEGALFPYFDSNAKRIKYYSGGIKYWWLRTPNSSYPSDVRDVNASGVLYNGSLAYNAVGVAPACNII